MSTPLLEVRDIQASYGPSQALFGMSFTVSSGQFVTLLGRNGMGKSSSVKVIMGLLQPSGGSIWLNGRNMTGQPSHKIARAGVGLVPEGRQIFPNLSVRENLIATAHNRHASASPWTLQRIFELFPRLAERSGNLGSNLSGGEQQMLAIGRALMTNPGLLILDEATEGLAPLIRAEIWQCLANLKSLGLTIICIDKNLNSMLELADHHHIVEKGRVVWSGSSAELNAQRSQLHAYLGV
ncbi:ABC transporter ATP-binding protein [Pusillimonas sp. MFBS29]|uniref:ABC transporter ATP-binding protein n=1 Tax=Pusillimonas sp. MFBS29 TaxID=2886690 RepID=UPI001D118C76|nr:ABC transporter ATP-binding protein [Pusillimonas sp. MFBS29]MCC2596070.1 ABC transporter ATP-binding protein [Pusillimonas sp. MFBS29]